jgi:hypothetical protein
VISAGSGLPATSAEETQGPRGQAVYSQSIRPLRTYLPVTVTITARDHPREGPDGLGRAAGLTLGGRLRTMRASLLRTQARWIYIGGNSVTREPPGALAERSGSERWPEQAAARPGRVGPA